MLMLRMPSISSCSFHNTGRSWKAALSSDKISSVKSEWPVKNQNKCIDYFKMQWCPFHSALGWLKETATHTKPNWTTGISVASWKQTGFCITSFSIVMGVIQGCRTLSRFSSLSQFLQRPDHSTSYRYVLGVHHEVDILPSIYSHASSSQCQC